MSVSWSRVIDVHFAAPPSARTARDGSRDIRRPSLSPPRFLSDRGVISPGTAGFGGRGPRLLAGRRVPSASRRPALTFGGSLDAPSTLPPSEPRMFSHQDQMRRLGDVVSAVRGELLHKRPSLPNR